MKICIAQTHSIQGGIKKNIAGHKKLIAFAINKNVDLMIFPELSLTGYQLGQAQYFAMNQSDRIFDEFQEISDTSKMSIGMGVPIKKGTDTLIGMVILQPKKPRQAYAKQYLHADEKTYFKSGRHHNLITINNIKIAPAICYESLLNTHSKEACELGAKIYAASVAKPLDSLANAFTHYSQIAKDTSMVVAMSNSIGHCEGYESGGKSSIWDSKGILVGQLSTSNEGILVYDTLTQEIVQEEYKNSFALDF